MEATLTAVLGAAATLLTAFMTRAGWTSSQKRAAALTIYGAVTLGVFLSKVYPATFQTVAIQFAALAGAGQIAFTILKPTGLLDWVEAITTPRKGGESGRPD